MARRSFVSRAPSASPQRRGRAAQRRNLHLPIPVNGFVVEIVSPPSGASSNDRTPNINYIATSVLGGSVDVVVEWRNEPPYYPSQGSTTVYPVPIYTQEVSASSGSLSAVSPPEDLAYGSWWYRIRAGNRAADLWSSCNG